MTGVVCDGVTVVNVSQVTMEIESCEGCVRRVSGGESEPGGRYLHTAVLTRVSESACVQYMVDILLVFRDIHCKLVCRNI